MPRVYIGPAGWSYADWDGIVYPRPRPAAFDPLVHLASYFDLIEINSTFYRVPARRTCQGWVRRIQDRPDFLFTVKASRELTHRTTPASEHEVVEFKSAVSPLFENERLGAVLIQFPWSFRRSPRTTEYVDTLTRWFLPYPTAVEVRHGSWGRNAGTAFFRDSRIPLCGIDQPMIGDSLDSDVSVAGESHSYFRLHGRNKREWFRAEANRDQRYDYLYSAEELAVWRDKIREVSEGVQKVFVVLNNHFRGQAVANALQLKAMMSNEKTKAPPGVLKAYPHLGDVLRPDRRVPKTRTDTLPGQLDLFRDKDNDENGDDREQNR